LRLPAGLRAAFISACLHVYATSRTPYCFCRTYAVVGTCAFPAALIRTAAPPRSRGLEFLPPRARGCTPLLRSCRAPPCRAAVSPAAWFVLDMIDGCASNINTLHRYHAATPTMEPVAPHYLPHHHTTTPLPHLPYTTPAHRLHAHTRLHTTTPHHTTTPATHGHTTPHHHWPYTPPPATTTLRMAVGVVVAGCWWMIVIVGFGGRIADGGLDSSLYIADQPDC